MVPLSSSLSCTTPSPSSSEQIRRQWFVVQLGASAKPSTDLGSLCAYWPVLTWITDRTL